VNDTAGFHGFDNEGLKALSRSISYPLHSDSTQPLASLFNRYGDQYLLLGTATQGTILVTTIVRFIDLNPTGQSIASRSDHCSA
jgi:hypothetical protein